MSVSRKAKGVEVRARRMAACFLQHLNSLSAIRCRASVGVLSVSFAISFPGDQYYSTTYLPLHIILVKI
jgi:hypothetical protein